MIPAQHDRGRTGIQNGLDMRSECRRKLADMAIVESQIAIVRDGKLAQHVKVPAIGRVGRLQRACLADGAGAKAGAGAVGDGLIKRHAGYRDVHTGQILGVFTSQERGRPAKGQLIARPFEVLAGKGHIHLFGRVFQCHYLPPAGCARSTIRAKKDAPSGAISSLKSYSG